MAWNLKIVSSGENKVQIYKINDFAIETGMVRNKDGKNGKGI